MDRNSSLETCLQHTNSELAQAYLGSYFSVIEKSITESVGRDVLDTYNHNHDAICDVLDTYNHNHDAICAMLSALFPPVKPIAFFAYFIAKCFELRCTDETNLHSDAVVLRVSDANNIPVVVLYGDNTTMIDKSLLQRCGCTIPITDDMPLCIPREVKITSDVHNPIRMISNDDISRLIHGIAGHEYYGYGKMSLYPHMMCLGICHKRDTSYNDAIVAYVDKEKGEKLWDIIFEQGHKLYEASCILNQRAEDAYASITNKHRTIVSEISNLGSEYTTVIPKRVNTVVITSENIAVDSYKTLLEYNNLMHYVIGLRARYIKSIVAYETDHIDKLAWYTTRIKEIVEDGKQQILDALSKSESSIKTELETIENIRDHNADR